MKRAILSILTAIGAWCFVESAEAAVPATFSFPVAKAPHPLPLDPSLSDPAWKTGVVPTRGAWENVTTRSAAALPTTAYVLYDDQNLYVGFVASQPGAPIVATQSTNDVGFGTDDFVGIGLDTSGAGSQAYFFETTPRGVRYEQASENSRYRPRWRSAAKIDGNSWRAVMIIPLNVLRIHAGSPQTWRIGFYRQVSAMGEHLSWGFDGLMQDAAAGNWPGFYDLRYWPAATGFDMPASVATRPKPRAEVYALESVGSDRELFQQANGQFLPEKVRPLGIDVSLPLASTVNFVGTLNPDFSNVEIDQQTIAPQEFPRQLVEYRPFFAQGASYLTPVPNAYSNLLGPANEIWYSPSVGPFDRGAKIEGTLGLQSFGAMSFRGYNEVSGETFNDVVYGYKHATQDQTLQYWSDGVLANHSVAGHDETFEAGVKGRNLHTALVWGLNGSVERNPLLPNGTAHSMNDFVDIHRPNYEVNVGYANISPQYSPFDGFTSNSDIRGLQGYVNFVGSGKSVKNWNFNVAGDRLLDRSGAVHESDFGMFLNATFKNGFSLNGLGPTISYLRQYDIPANPDCSGPSVGTTLFTGYPCYRNGVNVPFNLMGIPVGYHDGTPRPIDVSANWGRFNTAETHFYTMSTSRPLGSRFSLGLEYDASYQRDFTTGILDSQFLRRVSLGILTSGDSNLTLSLRDINGYGGFATQVGLNLAAAFHMRMQHGDLYVNYGTPAASATLHRLIVKYVIRAGADAGT